MGPLFNGMTISAERDVLAAGTAARNYYNVVPEETPNEGDQDCDDTVEPEPSQPQKDDINDSNTESEPSDIQKELENIYNELDPGNNPGNNPKVNEVAETLGKIVDVTETVAGAVNAIETLITDARALETALSSATPETALLNLLLQSLEDSLGKAIKKELENLAAEELQKKIEEELDFAFKEVEKEENFDLDKAMNDAGYRKVIDSGNPAVKGCAIAHSAAAMVVTNSTDSTQQLAVARGENAGTLADIAAKAGDAAASMGEYYMNEGNVSEGSSNVFFGGRAAARVNHGVDCDHHAYAKIAEGSKTVFANGWPIARVGNKLSCDGIVSEGVSRIFIDQDISSTFMLNINPGIDQQIFDLMPTLAYYLPILDKAYKEGKDLNDITTSVEDIKNS